MFQKLITKYGLATHLALLASLPFALHPFLSGRGLGITTLWLSGIALLWLLVEPSILAGERLSGARARVRREIACDPLFWCFLVVIAFAAMRWLNSGIALRYDAEQAVWAVAPPAVDMLPASAGDAGFVPFAVVVGIAVLSLGLLHGLGLAARVSFGMTAGFFFGVAGLVCAGSACLGNETFVQLAQMGFLPRPPVAPVPFYGTSFGLALLLSLVAGLQAEGRKWSASRLFFCVAVAGNLAGLLFFTPPILAIGYLAATSLFMVFAFVHLSRHGSPGGVAYSLTMIVFGSALAICLLFAMAPDNVVKAKTEGVDFAAAFPDAYRQVSSLLNGLGRSMWNQSPWRGAGVGAFNLQAQFLAEKADWELLAPGVSSALNGYWTVLAERGILGCMLLAGIGCMLVFEWGRSLVRAVAIVRAREDADIFIFACTPMAWVAMLALALFCAEALFSPVFSCSVALFAVVAVVALSAASFPRVPRPLVAGSD
ncbi:MAG: hypothetical protein IJ658_09985 [Kiritimatiellae bacterium]|nr:hypothetical protein [Kiritimatiellia bacterium]